MFTKQALALAAGASTASAAIYQGFNYGSATDFPTEFALAKSLAGTNGAFTSARLYTTIDNVNNNAPTSAISAAINADVSLLLGVWASAGQPTIDNEIAQIKAAIATYGSAFTSRVVGISVGSEDLYRNSPIGIANKDGVGANPDDLVNYIGQVRAAIAGTGLANVPVGHVDTYNSWINGSNSAVVSAVDFLGMDAYPYFQTSEDNAIDVAASLFFSAYDQTVAASQGKPVWVTETGWPASGPDAGAAVPSPQNARMYWDQVACKLLGQTNTWWYTLNDAGAAPSFGVTTGSSTPLYDLTCNATTSSSSSSSAPPSSTASSSTVSSASATASATSSAVSSSAAISTATSSDGASLSAHESTATPSNTIFPVSTSAVPTDIGGGSPGTTSVAGAGSSILSLSSASPSMYSSILSQASSALSAASTDSTATNPSVAVSTGMTSTMMTTSGMTTATTTAPVATYTGGASTLRSTGGIIAAIVALVAAL